MYKYIYLSIRPMEFAHLFIYWPKFVQSGETGKLHLQVRQISVCLRVQNESVQLGGRTEHGYSGEQARGQAKQVAAVRVYAFASGYHRRLGTSPSARVFNVTRFVGGCTSPSAATATTATALRQRASRRRSVP